MIGAKLCSVRKVENETQTNLHNENGMTQRMHSLVSVALNAINVNETVNVVHPMQTHYTTFAICQKYVKQKSHSHTLDRL